MREESEEKYWGNGNAKVIKNFASVFQFNFIWFFCLFVLMEKYLRRKSNWKADPVAFMIRTLVGVKAHHVCYLSCPLSPIQSQRSLRILRFSLAGEEVVQYPLECPCTLGYWRGYSKYKEDTANINTIGWFEVSWFFPLSISKFRNNEQEE